MGITANFGGSSGNADYGSLGTYKYVQGDTSPQMMLTLTDKETGFPIDLTTAQVQLHLRPVGGNVFLTRSLHIDGTTSVNGEALVHWETGDLDVDPGTYEAEIEILYSATLRETLFDVITLQIRADFA